MSVSTIDILPYFSKTELKDWQKLNTQYKISSYAIYLQWLEKNVTVPDRRGQFTDLIKSMTKVERERFKRLTNSWTKLHTAFFTLLPPQVLNFLNKQYDDKHLIDKSTALIHSDPISWETKEEVRFDFYSLVQLNTNNNLMQGLGQSESIPILPSKASPLLWIKMLKDLAAYRYLSNDYATNEELIKQWVASALSFIKTNTPTATINKLNWIGPATAFAEWLKEVQDKLTDDKHREYRYLLKWATATIDYPGTQQALRSALSSTNKYNSKYFSFMDKGRSVSFEVKMFPRKSKKKKR